MVLLDDIEKNLWRKTAVAALASVDKLTPDDSKDASRFASAVADAIVLAYRTRQKIK